MSGYNLPDDCNVSDLPGFRPEDVKRQRAYDQADADVKAGRY